MRARMALAVLSVVIAPTAALAQQQPPVSTFRDALALPVVPEPDHMPRLPGDRYQSPIRYAAPTAALARNPLFAAALTKAINQGGIGLPGTTLRTACNGFDTVGACVSALYAAAAIGGAGAFDQLREAMTGPQRLDLRDAIASAGRDRDAIAIERSAVRKAKADCKRVAESGY